MYNINTNYHFRYLILLNIDLNDFNPNQLQKEKKVIIVCSTQGEGDPPISAEEFYSYLNGPKIEDIWTDVTPFIPAQSYLITQSKINRIKHLLENTPWDAIDLWMCNVARLKIGTAEKIYTKHLPGYSIIEQTVKDGKTDNPLIFLEE